jgi:pyrimidine-nucleoside phosphorylase
MNTVELIRKKRNKENLTKEEILFLINNYKKNKIPDYQISAFLMAVYFNGMDKEETAALTEAMLYSGKVLNLNAIPGNKIDKHSTGGVGDKTSLIIAPIAAAAGVIVPMISGRGLGHSGGTLDKLESIPGFRTSLSLSEYKNVLKKCGAVLIGQTKEIAPADKLIYALRDVTATVESIPLITGSIMSKKLAEGIDGLVLDVKTGNGAFMQKTEDAIALADSLIQTAKAFDKKVIGFVTDMNQPLGNYIGNWLEVYESIEVLRDGKKNDLTELSLILAGAMIYLGKKTKSLDEGIELAINILRSGKAYQKFVDIVKAQNGNTEFIIKPEKYPKSKFKEEIKSESAGCLSEVNTYEIGMAAIDLGAGRKIKDDKIDPKAGIIFNYKIGDVITKGIVLAELYSNSKTGLDYAKKRILGAIKISNNSQNSGSKSQKLKLVKKIYL